MLKFKQERNKENFAKSRMKFRFVKKKIRTPLILDLKLQSKKIQILTV